VGSILLIGGGERGRTLASDVRAAGNVVRHHDPYEAGRAPIEATGAECWIGTPDPAGHAGRALDGVAIACWLARQRLRDARGTRRSSTARAFSSSSRRPIDTPIRGLLYEAAGSVGRRPLARGAEVIGPRASLNAIPLEILHADPADSRRLARGTRSRRSAPAHPARAERPLRSRPVQAPQQVGTIRPVAPQIVSPSIVLRIGAHGSPGALEGLQPVASPRSSPAAPRAPASTFVDRDRPGRPALARTRRTGRSRCRSRRWASE